ncbi:MAG: ATP-binding protein [Defluviicoccus sp.]|nr:ATP-binding protein [Defluviicoccus sp.]
MARDGNGEADGAELRALLARIADALERAAPAGAEPADLHANEAFVWHPEESRLVAVEDVNRLDLELLVGIDRPAATLIENTRRFARGLPANNALLWGARGMGKSSLVKAVHGAVSAETGGGLGLVEVHREDLGSLPVLLATLRRVARRFILFCDDLSFEAEDTTFKSLKALLEGGIEGRPANVIFYATSNRRHLMPREMIENEQSTAIVPAEAVDEKVSLSDRFGLWLGFHNCDQETYFRIVEGYAERYGLRLPREKLRAEAKEWSVTRGARSGRVAWQFIQDLAGRAGVTLDRAEGR